MSSQLIVEGRSSIEINIKLFGTSPQRYMKVLFLPHKNALRVFKFGLLLFPPFALHLGESECRVKRFLWFFFLVHVHNTEFLLHLLLWLRFFNLFILLYCLTEFSYLHTVGLACRQRALIDVSGGFYGGIGWDLAGDGASGGSLTVSEGVGFGSAVEGWG